jgi:N-acetylglutamate synthase-like GNAT family acetyltransferase
LSTTLHTPSADIAARVADAIVRETGGSDSEQIIDLINSVYAEYQGCVLLVDEEEPELKTPKTSFEKIGGRFWVAECDGNVCGTVALTPTDAPGFARLHKLYVSSAARSRGIGEALCNLAEQTAKSELHAENFMLYTDSRFLDAHRLYERLEYIRQPGLVERADASHSIEYVYTKRL